MERVTQTGESIPIELQSIPWFKYTPIKEPPKRGEWISEPYCGMRVRVWVPRGKPDIQILTEKEGTVTYLLPEIAEKFVLLSRYHSALLEGYVCKTETDNEREFSQSRFKIKAPANPALLARIIPCRFTGTDLLNFDDEDFTKFSTIERKLKLRRAITPHMIRTYGLRINYWIDDMPEVMAQHAKSHGFPGTLFRGKNDHYDNSAKWNRLEFHQF